MLKTLDIHNFSAFSTANLTFSPQLNVIAGENGTGKSHLLKLAYSILAVSAAERSRSTISAIEGPVVAITFPPVKTSLQTKLAEKLVSVFRAETLGRLARRHRGRARAEITCRFDDPGMDTAFSFSTQSETEVKLHEVPTQHVEVDPVFLPTRELLTICPGFVTLYEGRYLEFSETWRDTCLLLGAPGVRGPRERHVKELLTPLEEAMGGRVDLDRNGRFYLVTKQGRMEIHLVAEGLRKLAMVARLIASGALLDKGYLFWDEPEANLNPRLVKDVAKVILHLVQSNIQVLVATHSLFLMREFDIQLQTPRFSSIRARFFGLHSGPQGVEVEQGDSVDDIGPIASLDEELSQSQRYLEVQDALAH